MHNCEVLQICHWFHNIVCLKRTLTLRSFILRDDLTIACYGMFVSVRTCSCVLNFYYRIQFGCSLSAPDGSHMVNEGQLLKCMKKM